MKKVFTLFFAVILQLGNAQTVWNNKQIAEMFWVYQLEKPIEWQGHYYSVVKIYQAGHNATIRKIDINGNVVSSLESDSISFLGTNARGVTVVLDTASSIPKLSVIADVSNASQTVFLKADLDENLNVISTDSLICNHCSGQGIYNTIFGSGILLSPNHFAISGLTDLNTGVVFRLHFSTKEVVYNKGDAASVGGPYFQAYNPFKYSANGIDYFCTSHFYGGFLNIYKLSNLSRQTAMIDAFKPQTDTIFRYFQNCDGAQLSNGRMLSAGLFLYEFHHVRDTARAGIIIRKPDGTMVDTFSLPPLSQRWHEWVDFDFQDTNSIFIASTQLESGGNPFTEYLGHVELYKIGLGRQKHWAISLGRKPFFQVYHVKATSDGGVLIFARYAENFVWYAELMKIDGQGNFLFQTELEMKPTISAYPNPVKAGEDLYLDGMTELQTVEVANLEGKISILPFSIDGDKAIAQTRGLKPGQYVVWLQFKNGERQSTKLLVR